MPFKVATTKAKKTYNRTVKGVGGTLNRRIMKPSTDILASVVRNAPVVGRPLKKLARAPRAVTQAGTGLVLAIPKAAGTVASTGFKVAGEVVKTPFLALGAGDPLAKLGLLSKSKPKKKKASRRRK